MERVVVKISANSKIGGKNSGTWIGPYDGPQSSIVQWARMVANGVPAMEPRSKTITNSVVGSNGTIRVSMVPLTFTSTASAWWKDDWGE